MFHEALGSLLGQAGEALAQPGFGRDDDPRSAREARQVALLLIRTHAIWPALFAALDAENVVLRRGLDETNEVLVAHGLTAVGIEPGNDPLALHRELERALDRLIRTLADRADASWARESLSALRRRLVEAAEIQGRLVDQMLAIRLPSTGVAK